MNPMHFIVVPTESIPFFWVISIFILLIIVFFRVKPYLRREWSVRYQFAPEFSRSIMPSFVKLYNEIDQGNLMKSLLIIRQELNKNSAISFNKSLVYFSKIKSDPSEMGKYFQDKEILLFFEDPKFWLLDYHGYPKAAMGYKINEQKSIPILQDLEKLLLKFRDNTLVVNSNSFPLIHS